MAGQHTGQGQAQSAQPPTVLPAAGRDALTDVAGLRVGHARVSGDGALSGTTVVLAPEGGAVAAVDVRGGGPGTRRRTRSTPETWCSASTPSS